MTLGSTRLTKAVGRIGAYISYVRGPKNLLQAREPLFIGGTGGSGTRLIASLVEHAGYFIGSNLNRAQDSFDMNRFCDVWLERHLAAVDASLPRKMQLRMDRDLNRALVWHRSAIPATGANWALKHPRTVLMLPYLMTQHKGMKFIHVVRDGRDMAFSRNTNQLDLYGRLFVSDFDQQNTTAELAAQFWAKSNLRAKEFAEENLGSRYKCVRFDDICENPGYAISELFEWLGVGGYCIDSAVALVQKPDSIGRWQSESEAFVEKISRNAKDALVAFGYL